MDQESPGREDETGVRPEPAAPSTRRRVLGFGAAAAVLSAVLAVSANLSEVAGWITPDPTREIVEQTRDTVEATDARVNELLTLLLNQAAASGVELNLEAEATIRNAVRAIAMSGDLKKREALDLVSSGDVSAAAEALTRLATEQASAVSETGEVAAASWLEAAALYKTYDVEAAIRAYEEAARLQPGNPGTRDMLGHSYLFAGRIPEAESAFNQVLAGEAGLSVQSSSQYGLGRIAKQRGDYAAAAERYERALELAGEAKDVSNQIYALNGLGQLAVERGDLGTSRDFHEAALELADSSGDRRIEARILISLGILAVRAGEYDEAERQIREAIAIFEETKDTVSRADALGKLGGAALSRGDVDTAESILLETIDLKQSLAWDASIVYDLTNLGSLYAGNGEFEAADVQFARAETLAQQHELYELAPVITYNRGALAADAGDLATACRHFAAAAPVLEEMGSQHAALVRERLDTEC